MQATTEYKHIPDRPQALDAGWVEARYAALLERVSDADVAKEPDAWIALYEDWNATMAYVGGERARRHYRSMKDLRDEAAEAALREMRESIMPAAEDGDSALNKRLLASPHADAVGAHFGLQLLAVARVLEGPLDPLNKALRVQTADLAAQYDKLVGAAEVDVLGEQLTLARARGKLSSDKPEERRAAYEAYYGWYRDHRDELAQIYNQQVALRDRMGRNLGHENFVPLGYDGMERTDYGPEEVARFHQAVLEYATPLLQRQHERQAEALGTPTLRPWDAGYYPGRTLPQDVCEPIDQQLDKAGRIFERLSPRLSAHFERMRSEGLIDLENRKGKGAGAFCTSFPDEGRVAIFCNSTGDESDLATLTHEMGHAFQAWESQSIRSVQLQWPTSDAAEVHSMGMEFLALPYLDEFMDAEEAVRFIRARWSRAVSILCYVCLVDAFQTWVYKHPGASMDDRDTQWIRLAERYMPGVDWSGEAEEYRHTRWYAQLHIFRYPFYYIDYALAETGAMQFALLDAQDHDACLQKYLALCELGGTLSITKMFAQAGLRSPFEKELMRDLMAHAEQQL